ncbi:MAG: hypothetical protein FWE57_08880 [Chitinispirillia bacterium]|nr:hypothetical protein [Chitinispirillia bacterium]
MKKICLAICLLALSAQVMMSNAQTLSPEFKWGNVAIGGGGFVSAIIADPLERNLFYARTDVGGAYRWDHGASKWISMMDWVSIEERGLLGIEAIAVDPKTPGKVYMVAGTSYWNDGRSAFLRSSDRGVTWEVFYTWDPQGVKGPAASSFGVHGNGMGRGNGEALAVDPNDPDIMFYGSKNRGLFKSTNNGRTWNHVPGFTTAAGSDTTWNGSGFSFVAFAPGSSSIMYAGFLRGNNNVFQSADGGTTWSVIPNRPRPATRGGYIPPLMPQRIAITPNNSAIYITFADGAGPHTMKWDEGWGPISELFGRGAVLKYEPGSGTWTNVSPQNFVDFRFDDPSDNTNYDNPDEYLPPYGGISMNPQNPLEIVVSHLGYWGTQWWVPGGDNGSDQWGSNIYYTDDGGETWTPTFPRWYPMPSINIFSENGIGWMRNSSIHWSGSILFDPFDSNNLWVTSGNGIFATSNIKDNYIDDTTSWQPELVQRTLWRVMSHGIEETVPIDVVSVPGGPLVSVILDYDGFRHNDITQFPSNRHMVSGLDHRGGAALGHNIALAYAPKAGRLVKVSDNRVFEGQHNNIPYWPVQFSSDTGRTWTVTAYQNNANHNLPGAEGVSISTDGQVVLWTPDAEWGNNQRPVQRLENSMWSVVSGINGSYTAGDPENANVFYAYNRWSGKFFRSEDKGATFTESSTPGESGFKKFRLVPNKEGDVWLPLGDGGLVRSTDGGATFTSIATVPYCEAVGFGKAAPDKDFPTVFVYGTIGGTTGVFMSIDEGANWWRVNDDKHQYGGLANGEFVVGDMNVYGRVYMSTAGRGIVYGEFTGQMVSARHASINKTKAAGNVRVRGAAITINADNQVSHHVRVFDLKGRQIYKKTVLGSAVIPMNRVLPKGNYVVSVRRDGAEVHKSKMRIVK